MASAQSALIRDGNTYGNGRVFQCWAPEVFAGKVFGEFFEGDRRFLEKFFLAEFFSILYVNSDWKSSQHCNRERVRSFLDVFFWRLNHKSKNEKLPGKGRFKKSLAQNFGSDKKEMCFKIKNTTMIIKMTFKQTFGASNIF